jgi:hypothetical protein
VSTTPPKKLFTGVNSTPWSEASEAAMTKWLSQPSGVWTQGWDINIWLEWSWWPQGPLIWVCDMSMDASFHGVPMTPHLTLAVGETSVITTVYCQCIFPRCRWYDQK